MKRSLFFFLACLFAAPSFAAVGSLRISFDRPTTYVDGSPLPVSAITGYGIQCVFTPTGGTAAPCSISPAVLPGSVVTGTTALTYPASGGRACVRLVTRTAVTEAVPSNEACADFAALAPSPATGVTVTITIGVTVNGVAITPVILAENF